MVSIGFLSGWMDLGWMVDLLPNQSHHYISPCCRLLSTDIILFWN
jgi:hypothetical protein